MSLDVFALRSGLGQTSTKHVRTSLEHVETKPLLDRMTVKHVAYHLTVLIPRPTHDAQ
jgi:hypothetical protein